MNLINMKTLVRMGALLLAAAATSAFAGDADRVSAWSAAKANQVQMRPGLGVPAGQAPIEQALLTLVPPPYQIQLADTIDRGTVLSWDTTDDWMVGLRQAVDPHGLVVTADWNRNILTVTKSRASRVMASYSGAEASSARSVTSASGAGAAPASGALPGEQQQARSGVASQGAAPAPAAASQTWAILPSDGSLSRALMRWSREARTQIAYEAPQDLAAVSVAYTGDFWAALESLLADTANGGYPLHGCQYNNITRILHISQPCDR